MGRYSFNPYDRFLHQRWRHIIQHNNICSSRQGLVHLCQILSLYFDRHCMRNSGTGSLHGWRNTARSLNMIILNHNRIVQPEPVICSTAYTHSILLQHPVPWCRLACIHEADRKPLQCIDILPRPCRNPRQSLQQIQCKALTCKNTVCASLHLS
ncbi:hypothetical protein D3C77_602460 [compost metagenome]